MESSVSKRLLPGYRYYSAMDPHPLPVPYPQYPLQNGEMHALNYNVRSESVAEDQEFGASGPEPVHAHPSILPIQAPTKQSKVNASVVCNESLIDWASIRKPFEKAYKTENKNLTDTMKVLEDEYNFRAS